MSDSKNKIVRYIKRMGAGSMLISIIVHVVVIIIATVWVVSSVHPQRKAMFKGGDDAGSTVQHPVKMSNTQPHLDTLTKRLSVDTPDAAVDLPDFPSLDTGMSSPALDTKLGTAGGRGGLKGPIMPAFGFKEPPQSGALTGTLYLIPSDHYKTNDAEQEGFKSWLRKFNRDGWPESTLARLKKSPLVLYCYQIAIPKIIAQEAPKAFGVPPQEGMLRYLIRYRGKVSPPRNGKWRFVGFGDDIMIVRINGHVVLEASAPWGKGKQTGLTGWSWVKTYDYTQKSSGHYIVGDWMQLDVAKPVDMEIYLSEECRTGNTSAMLLVEEAGATHATPPGKLPILPFWTLSPNHDTTDNKSSIPVASNAPVWTVHH